LEWDIGRPDSDWQTWHRETQDEDHEVRRTAAKALGGAFYHVPDKVQAWQDLIRLSRDNDNEVRWTVAKALGKAYLHISDKSRAWQDLHGLSQDKDNDVRRIAAYALGDAFSQVPDKSQAWQDLHRLSQDEDNVRRIAADALCKVFHYVPDNAQAWQDLIRLTRDGDKYVRERVTYALGDSFSHAPDKAQAWQDLIRLTQDKDNNMRRTVADALGNAFSHVPEKAHAWQDLISLTQDKDSDVRRIAANALGNAFSHVPDKVQAWQDLHTLTQDEDNEVRRIAAKALGNGSGNVFSHIPDKAQAWQDLIRLTQDEDCDVAKHAADVLYWAFPEVPDKVQAWRDLIKLTQKDDYHVRDQAAQTLKRAFSHVSDRAQIWQDLHRLTHDRYDDVRRTAAIVLGSAFSEAPDKAQAWQDLHRLTRDEDNLVRDRAAGALGNAFSHVPDKVQAWQDLHRLTHDKDYDVRGTAANVLCMFFSEAPDKAQAWQDLHRLALDEYYYVNLAAAEALGKFFSEAPDKAQAWQDLIRLTHDMSSDKRGDSDVRGLAACALDRVFYEVPDKAQAWNDLHELTHHFDSTVRKYVSAALGGIFSEIPDKAQAWQDLIMLTEDEESFVRMYAYHSLGRASVFKGTEAHNRDTLKKELDAAVAFFEKSSRESEYSPAKFCHPFYRSYLAITFLEAKEEEVQKYLAEAKKAVGTSESKDFLLKAVENLANALKESQCLKERPITEIEGEINVYRWYCDKAAEHMKSAEDKAPGVVKLMRACNPFLDERIQATIDEIQKSAKNICQITRRSGTEYEVPGSEIYKAAGILSSDNLASVQISIPVIVKQLKKFCKNLPGDERDTICKTIEEIEREPRFPEKLNYIALALSNLGPILQDYQQSLADIAILTVLPEEYSAVYNQLSDYSPPPDMGSRPNLYAWQFGNVYCSKYKGAYRVAVGMIGRAGNYQSALAVKEAIDLLRPRYIFFIGIAGGLPDLNKPDVKKGDVVIADVVYGYEYGKIGKKFKPRGNWTYRTDLALLNGASVYSLRTDWLKRIKVKPPEECRPDIICGEVASGEQVIDDPTNEFFAQVLKRYSKLKAVEMEGAGVGNAIEHAQSLGTPVGFMMIRGISDLPRTKGKGRGTKERDDWKPYASDVAAAFAIGWIVDGLPLRPSD
jgi:HEAT repeat protein/nucleoside phosphorylase